MRIIINSQEFYIFKDLFYRRPIYYYNNEKTSLAEKYFEFSDFKLDNNTKKIVHMLINSTEAPELIQKPKEVKVSKEDQYKELKSFLKDNFYIIEDERGRFYGETFIYVKNKNKHNFFSSYRKKKKIFFSWEEVLQLYNTSPKYIQIKDISNKKLSKKTFIMKKVSLINRQGNLKKKYVYVNLKKTKKRGVICDSETVVTLPA